MQSRFHTVADVLAAAATAADFCNFDGQVELSSVGIFGNQPLAIVVTWDDARAVELLLDAGAPINAKHEDGDTALHHAIRMGHFGIARLLIARGADQAIRNDEGKLARDYCWNEEWQGLGLSDGA
jgi:ankyrin repeat protein